MTQVSTPQDAITAANQQFMKAFNSGDAAGIARLYTDNGQVLPPNSDAITGHQGIQSFWQGAMDMGIANATLESTEVIAQDNGAYEVGRYTLAASNGQVLDRGKYLVIWHREGGQWKLHRDIWNSNLPATGQ